MTLKIGRHEPYFSAEYSRLDPAAVADLPGPLRTEEFFRLHELTNVYIDARVLELIERSELEGSVIPSRSRAWGWLLRRAALAARGIPEPGELRKAILEEHPSSRPSLDLIDVAAEGYPDFLAGARTGNAILFDPKRPTLWEEYFSSSNPIYAATNLVAARAAAQVLERSPGPYRGLEIGAGCGSAAEALLAEHPAAFTSYRLTDLAPGFLRKARERLEGLHLPAPAPRLSYQLLDLNASSSRWPVRVGDVDWIHAVNVLHAVRDLGASLRGLAGLLPPGGVLVLGECVRPRRGEPVPQEFVFQLLDEFREVALDPEARPDPGFLDAAAWRTSLEQAGFRDVRFFPDFEAAVKAYPAHSLAAILAWRA